MIYHQQLSLLRLQVGAAIAGRPGNLEDSKSLKQLNFQVHLVAAFCH